MWKLAEYTCADFYVRAAGDSLPEVLVTSIGLGQTILSLPSGTSVTDCSAASNGNVLLRLTNLGREGQRIRLRVPRNAFPETGSTVEGKILVLVPQKESVEIPLRLEGRVGSNFLTAAVWFAGIAIPALVTALLGYLVYTLEKGWEGRSGEQLAFRKYKSENWGALSTLFLDFYPVLCEEQKKNGVEWARQLHEKLRLNGWDKIPQKQRDALLKTLASYDQAKIARTLADIFSYWRTAIEAPWKKPEGE